MDKKDLKIMDILAHNCRIPNSTIAEAVNISKDSVAYRIKKLEKNKYISDYLLFIDSKRMGYTRYQILIQLDSDTNNKEEIYKKISKLPFVLWINTFIGRYDLQVIVDAKDQSHLNEIRKNIFRLCNNKIREDKVLTTLFELEFTHLNPEIDLNTNFKKKGDHSFSSLISKRNFAVELNSKEYKLSDVDIELLKLLADNPRVSILELTSSLKIDRKTVKKRLNNLIQERVISNFGTIIDPTKFGYVTYALFTRISQDTPDEILKEPFKELNNIFFAARMMGEYDFIFYLYAKSPQELNNTLDIFKKKVGKHIISSDLFIQDKVLFWRQYNQGIYKELKKSSISS